MILGYALAIGLSWTNVRWGRNAFSAHRRRVVVIGIGRAMAAAGSGAPSHPGGGALERRSRGRGADGAGAAVFADVWRAELEPHRRCERVELRADERRPGQRARAGDPSPGGRHRRNRARYLHGAAAAALRGRSLPRGAASSVDAIPGRRVVRGGGAVRLGDRLCGARSPGVVAWASVRLRSSSSLLATPFHQTPRAICLLHDSICALDGAADAVAVRPVLPIRILPCLTTDARPAPFSEDLLNGEAVMLPERTSCPPDPRVIEWIRTQRSQSRRSSRSIAGIRTCRRSSSRSRWWCIRRSKQTFENEEQLFGRYYGVLQRTDSRRAAFSRSSTRSKRPQQRSAFIDRLGVTHVLVDPAYYREMRAGARPAAGSIRAPFQRGRVGGVRGASDPAPAFDANLQVAYDE